MLRFRNHVAPRSHAQTPTIVTWRWRFAIVATTVVLGGCADGSPSRGQLLSEGRRVFVNAGCGVCHAVASVHTHGGVGPNFDTSEQLNRDQIRIQLDYGGGGMPPFRDRLTGRQRNAVIEFVYETLHHHR
jgi:mono/diheme cytochrome c family protein